MKELAAAHLHGDAGEQQDGGVDVEDGRDGERMPVQDVGSVAIKVAGGLAEEESGHERHEEHEVAGQGGEDTHAVASEQGTWATAMTVVPVFVAATAAGGTTIYRWSAAKSRVFPFTLSVDYGPGEGGRHGRDSIRTYQLTPVGMLSPTVE